MRKSGILMHISSLPSVYGIGTLGKEAYSFCDFLNKSGQKYWQVLPVNPTGFGDSPYQSPSAFAGNPYFIDLDILSSQGLLNKAELESYPCNGFKRTDYNGLFKNRYQILKKAFGRFKKSCEYTEFVEENSFWLEEFAFYMAVKEKSGYCSWTEWDGKIKARDPEALECVRSELFESIDFYKFLQFEFFMQWSELKKYANSLGIEIIGDMPIYVALDSAEVWSNPGQFLLDEDGMPIKAAGCPPDAFSEKGQFWGNPLYRWDRMEDSGFEWWIKRLSLANKLYDRIRIDHFRGFEAYYAIEYGREDACVGEWEKGPGIKFFNAVKEKLGELNIIAEDLGFLTPQVRKLLSDCGFPGMKVLQFAFDPDGDSEYLPHNHVRNCVLYTGTHDNDTVLGWYENLGGREKVFAEAYLRIRDKSEAADALISAAMASVAETVIIPIQDYLGLGSEARMNTPSVMGGNWTFRVRKEDLNKELMERIRGYTTLYKRD